MGNALSRNAGSTKWRLHWGYFRGSSWNLKWSKRGVWWVDQWVLISWLHIEDIWCMLGFYIHLRLWHVDRVDWFILIEDSDAMISSVFHWYIRLRLWHARLLMIDLIALLSMLTLILSWLFWSLHMHTLTTVHHSTWHADPLVGILFDHLWACYLGITIHLIVVFSLILCVYIDDISEICLIVCCMTTLLCVIACRLSVWVAHLSPYLPLSSLGHFLHSGSRFCKCEALCVLVLWPR